MMIKFKTHTGSQKEWGYEIPTTFTDSENGRVYERIMLFPKEPTKEEIDKMADFWIAKINLPEEVDDEMVSKKEVEALLVAKGHLSSEESLEDLKSLTEK